MEVYIITNTFISKIILDNYILYWGESTYMLKFFYYSQIFHHEVGLTHVHFPNIKYDYAVIFLRQMFFSVCFQILFL